MSSNIHLLDLIRREKLESILQGFTEVAGIASIIADADGLPLTKPYNFTSFCLQYCRSTEEGRRRCHLSDRFGGEESLRTGSPPIYHCLNAGLMDCAAPIIVGGRHLATILCGQVLDEPITSDVGQQRARSIGVTNIDGYLKSLEAVPSMSRDRLLGIANLMAVITRTVSELALQKYLQQKHSRRYLHNLINSISDCIVSTNMDGIISIINEAGADLFGYEADELIGRSILDLFLDEGSKRVYQSRLEQSPGGESRMELNAVRSSREPFPIQVSVAGIPRENGRSADYVTVIRDISEQRNIDRMKEDLIGMVAHDIKNPVLSIQKALELLVSGAMGPLNGNQAEITHFALDTSHQLFGMVSNLLDIYRRENGRFLLDTALVDINGIIHESMGRLKLLARDRRVEIHFEPSPGPCNVQGDLDRLTRACINLLENAVKYSPEGGVVRVSSVPVTRDDAVPPENLLTVAPNDHPPAPPAGGSPADVPMPPLQTGERYVLVTVSDRGPGIPREYRKAVFERFFTIQGPEKQRRTGLGLGLTFCRQIVEAHGGAIWVQSPSFRDEKGEMRGCAFQFVLPVIRED